MSTAVMTQNAIYDFGDILLKNGVNNSDISPGTHIGGVSSAAVRLSLARMVSSPAAPITSSANLAALIGNLTQQHRRLERTQSAPAPASSVAASAVNTSRYKTELCRPYEEFGVCKYGDKCQFAHGVAELRSLARHPKYKTELCRTYHTVGFCPYGPRCHFVHNQDEVIQQHREHQQQHRAVSAAIMVNRSPGQQQPRPRPSALSPALSLDSPSPPSSLSQSPTSSMSSFFSSEPELHSPGAAEEQRLPVFNRISAPLLAFSDFLL